MSKIRHKPLSSKHAPFDEYQAFLASFRRKPMIIVTMDGELVGHFEDYNDLFENLTGIENTKFTAVNQNLKDRDWGFVIHPPHRVAALYAHLKDKNDAIREAYDEGLSLIEICAGDYSAPTYIAHTPNIDLDYLKKKWCVDYCTWHHLVVREI